MKSLILICAVLAILHGCKSNDSSGQLQNESGTLASKRAGEIDPEIMNAYQIWAWTRSNWDPETKYPSKYFTFFGDEGDDNRPDNDATFYEDGEDFTRQSLKDGKKTFDIMTNEKAKVKGRKLSYSENSKGQTLTMEFGKEKSGVTQLEAAKACKSGERLPTIMELFDYCTAGSERDPKSGGYKKSRCEGKTWSMTLNKSKQDVAWVFDADEGGPRREDRTPEKGIKANMMCVSR